MTSMVTVNGTNLDNLVAQGIDDISGIHTVPAKRTPNVQIPGRHGALNVPQKRYDQTSLVMPMWVRGVNPDGTIPTDPVARLQFHARLRTLVQLFTIGELVTIQHILTDGTARQIVAEVDSVINFAISAAGRYTLGKFSVGLTAADPFWSDLTTTAATFTLTTGQSSTLTGFAAASAPMDNLTVTFGPCSNPTLTQLSTGAFVTYNGIIGAGQQLAIDTQAWTVTGTLNAGGTWNPATAPTQHIARIQHGGGGGRLFSLAPQNGGPVVQLVHTGGGTATVTITGPQRYLVP